MQLGLKCYYLPQETIFLRQFQLCLLNYFLSRKRTTVLNTCYAKSSCLNFTSFIHDIIMPPPRRGGIKRWRVIGVRRPSVCPSVCLMSRTSALTRTPKGLGRRNFAQGYPRSHATPTPTSRSKGQKSRSRGGGILWRPPSHTACSRCPSSIRLVTFRVALVNAAYAACRLLNRRPHSGPHIGLSLSAFVMRWLWNANGKLALSKAWSSD